MFKALCFDFDGVIGNTMEDNFRAWEAALFDVGGTIDRTEYFLSEGMRLEEVAKNVRNGQSLGKQLLAAQYFPPIVGQMMGVGEETGKIDEILLKVAEFYEEEVDAVVDGLASIIEPVMIVMLGAIVGLIAASVMGPIAGLSKNIGG